MPINEYKREAFVVLFILAFFVLASYFSQAYTDTLTHQLGKQGVFGMAIYVLGAMIATVIAPMSFLPILPIAVTIWGSFMAAVLSIIAWTLGAAIAFIIARRYGRPLVENMVGKRKMNYMEGFLPKRYLFLAVVFLRIALPVDLLSYALGLFGVMTFWPYIAATIIGITPFAFVFSYIADIDIMFQVGAFVIGAFFIILSYPYMKSHYSKTFMEDEK